MLTKKQKLDAVKNTSYKVAKNFHRKKLKLLWNMFCFDFCLFKQAQHSKCWHLKKCILLGIPVC